MKDLRACNVACSVACMNEDFYPVNVHDDEALQHYLDEAIALAEQEPVGHLDPWEI